MATSPTPAVAPAAECGRPASPWLIGPTADLLIVFGLGAAFSVALALAWHAGTGFLVLAALFALFVDFPHVLQTTMRVWLDPRERALHARRYVVSLVLIGAAVGTLAATGHFPVVLTVFVGWQVLHVVKQHIGMVAMYAARSGYRRSRSTAKRVLVAGCLAPVLYRGSEGLELGHYVVGGRPLPFSDVRLPIPLVPWPLVAVAYLAFAVLAVWFVTEQAGLRRSGAATLPAPALLTIGTSVLFYNLSYLLISDPYALILIATTFHGLQYHLISWARMRGRYATSTPGERGRGLLGRLACPRAVVPILLILVLAGAPLSAAEFVLAGAVPFTVVLHHFYLDGVLWKPRRNPGLAGDLALGSR